MKKLIRSQKGQSFVELAMVIFLFMMFITGIMQIVMLGSGLLKCEMAARRAAWVTGTFGHLGLTARGGSSYKAQIEAILTAPDLEYERKGDHTKEGEIVTVKLHVQSIGFFHLIKPDGFNISATNAVISYTKKPWVAEGVDAIWDWITTQIGGN